MTAPQPIADDRRGVAFWVAVAAGWAMIGYGVRGITVDDVDLVGFARWFVGLAVVHDALVAPVVFGVAWLAGRLLPRLAVVPVRLGLASSALVALYAWPLARGYGRAASNPTALPLDYRRNLVISLLAIWIAVASGIGAAFLAGRATRATERTGEGSTST